MAETVRQNLTMAWGDTPVWVVTVTDRVTGAVVNITGCTMKFTAKWRASDADAAAVFQKSVGAGISLTDPTNGVAQVQLATTDTSTLSPGRSHLLTYDWKMTLGGQVTTVAFGRLSVEPAMTRSA